MCAGPVVFLSSHRSEVKILLRCLAEDVNAGCAARPDMLWIHPHQVSALQLGSSVHHFTSLVHA